MNRPAPASVVGTCTKSSPRRTADAAKPARSPITPPPSATIEIVALDPRGNQFLADPLEDRIALRSLHRPARSPCWMSIPAADRMLPRPQMKIAPPSRRSRSRHARRAATPQYDRSRRREQIAADDDVIGATGECDIRQLPARRNASGAVIADTVMTHAPPRRLRDSRASAAITSSTITSCSTSRESIVISASA